VIVYVGTFTYPGRSQGLYVCHADASGRLRQAQRQVLPDPSYLVLSPDSPRRLYALCHRRDFAEARGGGLVEFGVDQFTGMLTKNWQAVVPVPHPAYGGFTPGGRHLITASPLGGAICLVELLRDGSGARAVDIVDHEGTALVSRHDDPDDDRVGWPPAEVPPAGAPMPHAAVAHPVSEVIYVPDRGLSTIRAYTVRDQRLVPQPGPCAVLPAGAGPRHIDFDRTGRTMYVINEINSTVSVFRVAKPGGALRQLQTLPSVPDGAAGADGALANEASDIHLHPSGQFLYASNRGHDSIAFFSVDPADGRLTTAGWVPSGGRCPRNFVITPDGSLLLCANQGSSTVVAFAVSADGSLRPTGAVSAVPSPTCLVIGDIG
jgi:6-phosphogluconolactonase